MRRLDFEIAVTSVEIGGMRRLHKLRNSPAAGMDHVQPRPGLVKGRPSALDAPEVNRGNPTDINL
eukprot:CAMPEP_0118894330 /NCGR_PEP_ID=MMETSP1166-20130328/3150_1 /TAXON_ID=1104430 /ORGANISM="Chrysoreinhardia sp, Strain CCMP3193" /LENGTH=64 /DNA_ID=CAMNT_0006833221 /DNA_START=1190 /DNA_END=1384 /DNA_ORIENTATION=+